MRKKTMEEYGQGDLWEDITETYTAGDDIYNEVSLAKLVDDDEISAEEEGFMTGWMMAS